MISKKAIVNYNCFDGKYDGEVVEVVSEYSTKYHSKIEVITQAGSKLSLYGEDVEPLMKRVK